MYAETYIYGIFFAVYTKHFIENIRKMIYFI